MKRAVTLAALSLCLSGQPTADHEPHDGPVQSFRPLSTFLVPDRNSAEAVAATPDGMTLVYTDAIGNTLGVVDMSNPSAPAQVSTIGVDGQPTSVAVTPDGRYAIVAVRRTVWVEDQPVDPAAPGQPGDLQMFDLHNPAAPPVRYAIAAGPGGALGYLPDAVALGTLGGQLYAVVALENEPIVLRRAGAGYVYVEPEPPGLPACVPPPGGEAPHLCDASGPGYLQIVRVNTGATHVFDFVSNAVFPQSAMAELLYAADPQPEYVAFRDHSVAVTLQENNGIAVVDVSSPASPAVAIFPAGVVESRRADLLDDETISFTQMYPDDVQTEEPAAGTRMPDAIAWTADGTRLLTANEGEPSYTGGRGWSVFHYSGALLWDDAGTLEQAAVRRGFYPDGRSDAKGVEMEGIATGRIGGREFAFVTSERGSFVAVYDLEGPQPRFLQLLPTGIAPEAALAIPTRGLFVTANEGDDGDGSISIFEGVPGLWQGTFDRPLLESHSVDQPWSALSGFAADPSNGRRLFAVPDDALPSEVYRIDVQATGARVAPVLRVTRSGVPVRYDLEGIGIDTSIEAPPVGAGFWLASEGNASCVPSSFTRNLLLQVNVSGQVLREIGLPASIEPGPSCTGGHRPAGSVTSNGFEGVAITADGRYLLAAIQRPFAGEAAGTGATHTRIARYDLLLERWDFFAYPLSVSSTSTIGLSEIVPFGHASDGQEVFGVIERDNRYGLRAIFKRVYTLALPEVSCAATDTLADCVHKGAVVSKALFEDVADDFAPLEKVESLAMTALGDVWMALDNDGGEIEPRLVRIRRGGNDWRR